MAPAKSRCAPSAVAIGVYVLNTLYSGVRSEYSFPFVFSPCVIPSASPLEQNRILGDTDLGEVAEAASPTSDVAEGFVIFWWCAGLSVAPWVGCRLGLVDGGGRGRVL